MKSTCGCGGWHRNPHLGLLILRIVTGFIFIYQGLLKFQNMAAARESFALLHVPMWIAPIASTIEVAGGVLLIFGVFTFIASFLLGLDILSIVLFISFHSGGWAQSEFGFLLLASLIAIGMVGGGRYKMRGGCGYPGCRDAAVCKDCGHESGGTTCTCVCHQ